MIIIGLNNSKQLARDIAKKLNIDYFDIETKFSNDEEIHFKFKKDVKDKKVFLVQSFYPNPNNALMEVLFAASHARDLKAKEVILIAPYLSHLREEFRKEKYECTSIRLLGDILSNSVDSLIVVDPHVQDLKKYFSIPVHVLSSSDLIKNYIKKNYDDVVVVGADENSRNLVAKMNLKNVILKKKRKDELNVSFSKGFNLKDKNVVIVDDMAITGTTLKECVKYLGLSNNVECVVVHPLITKYGIEELKKYSKLASCNSITNETNKIDLSGLIAGKIKNEWQP